MLTRFNGQFDALTKQAGYCNDQRFRPLKGKAKPLWEFKEHDHRFYCYRRVAAQANMILVVLYNGWIKDKEGKTEREDREINKALSLHAEFLEEFPGGGNR